MTDNNDHGEPATTGTLHRSPSSYISPLTLPNFKREPSPPRALLAASAVFGLAAVILSAVLSWYWFYYPWLLTVPAVVVLAISLILSLRGKGGSMSRRLAILSMAISAFVIVWSIIEIALCNSYACGPSCSGCRFCENWDQQLHLYNSAVQNYAHLRPAQRMLVDCGFMIMPNDGSCYSSPILATHHAISWAETCYTDFHGHGHGFGYLRGTH